MTLGYKIKSYREERGLTQVELAEKTRLTQGSISKIEKGDLVPRDATLIVLAVALGLEPTALLKARQLSR